MHNAAFRASGFPGWYEAIDLPPEALPTFVATVRQPPWLGVNVTIPYKEQVAKLVDELAGEAARARAVNTIVRRGSQLVGYNTDSAGFLRALREDAGFEPRGCAAVILGAGGAARACVLALAQAGARHVTIINRSPERAARLVAELEVPGVMVASDEAAAAACQAADLVVNATAVGMAGGPAPEALPLPLGWLPRSALVYDLVYRPMETPLLAAARQAGLATLGGLAMLIYQGAVAFELWTGQKAPLAQMRAAAMAMVEETPECSVS
jgi:shikimate dehydrogenase